MFIVLFFIAVFNCAMAQTQNFVITPTMSSQAVDDVPLDITLIDSEKIESNSSYSITELLNNEAGITAMSSGSIGQQTTLFLQGADGEDILVMVDGVKINDPSTPSAKADLSMIDPDNIESIEILKGPQSGLYGADAFAGVINIITKNKKGTSVSLNGGAHSTIGTSATHRYKSDKWSYKLQGTLHRTSGFSNVDGGSERDGHKYKSTQAGAAHHSNGREASIQLNYLKREIDLDQSGIDDPNYTENDENFRMQTKLSSLFFNSLYKAELQYNFNKISRHSINLADSGSATTGDYRYKAKNHQIRQTNLFHWNKELQTLLGFDYGKEIMSSYSESLYDKDIDTRAVFLQQSAKLGRIKAIANIRYDDSGPNNDFVTYRLGLHWDIDAFKIQGSFSSATKKPTLYQLYSSYGETNLKEESQLGGNLAISYRWNKGKIKANFFEYHIEDLIDFNMSTFKYYNVGKVNRKGLELSCQQQIAAFNFGASYTFTEAKQDDGSDLIKRPRHQVSINGGYKIDKLSINLFSTYMNRRTAYSGGTMPSFVRFDLTTKYAVNKNIDIALQWNNIFDQDYQLAEGYQTEGSSLYGKLDYKF